MKTYQAVLYKDWAKRGIYMINDVLDETGKIVSFQKFQDTYNITTTNTLLSPDTTQCTRGQNIKQIHRNRRQSSQTFTT